MGALQSLAWLETRIKTLLKDVEASYPNIPEEPLRLFFDFTSASLSEQLRKQPSERAQQSSRARSYRPQQLAKDNPPDGARLARWHNKNLFPSLKYKTQEDNRVRPEHQALNNFIAPIDDPAWDRITPPNGWRCRCYLVQTAEKASETTPDINKEVKPEFQVNVGKTGQIFNEDSKTGHKFFALAKDTPGWEKRFELSKLEGPYDAVKTPKGNTVKVSIYADDREDEYQPNIEMAIWASDTLDYKMKINPHLDGRIVKDESNPEFTVNTDKIGDRKTPTEISYKNILRKANKQGIEIVFVSLALNKDNLKNAYSLINNILKDENIHQNIKLVYIVNKNKSEYLVYKRQKATK